MSDKGNDVVLDECVQLLFDFHEIDDYPSDEELLGRCIVCSCDFIKLAGYILSHFSEYITHLVIGYSEAHLTRTMEKPFASFTWNLTAKFGCCPFVIAADKVDYMTCDGIRVWEKDDGKGCNVGNIAKDIIALRPETIGNVMTSSSSENVASPTIQSAATSKTESSESELDHEEKFDVLNSQDELLATTSASDSNHQKVVDLSVGSEIVNCFWYRPNAYNFFVCQRIHSTSVTSEAYTAYHQLSSLLVKSGLLVYKPAMWHLTMATFSLKDLTEVENCFASLKRFIKDLPQDDLQLDPLVLRGMDHFSKRVIYFDVNEDSKLCNFVKNMKHAISCDGFEVNKHQSFKPHVTVAKSSKSGKNVSNALRYCADQDLVDFGLQPIYELQLCLMGQSRDESGFYHSFGSVFLHE